MNSHHRQSDQPLKWDFSVICFILKWTATLEYQPQPRIILHWQYYHHLSVNCTGKTDNSGVNIGTVNHWNKVKLIHFCRAPFFHLSFLHPLYFSILISLSSFCSNQKELYFLLTLCPSVVLSQMPLKHRGNVCSTCLQSYSSRYKWFLCLRCSRSAGWTEKAPEQSYSVSCSKV